MSPISKTASPGYALTPGQVAEVLAQACPATEQWDRFNHYPWGVLAHCAHVHGLGTFENGIEKPRACLTRATQIPPEKCKRINLGYRDPAGIRVEDFANREDEGILPVPKAGERLYRLNNPPDWAKDDFPSRSSGDFP